eukprot:517992-Pyramimonas_sp.AAC.1
MQFSRISPAPAPPAPREDPPSVPRGHAPSHKFLTLVPAAFSPMPVQSYHHTYGSATLLPMTCRLHLCESSAGSATGAPRAIRNVSSPSGVLRYGTCR